MEKERKFLFDVNVFDAPPKEEIADAPPPPPTFSEDELAAAKDMAFEQGRQQGHKEQLESREQAVRIALEQIAKNFSHLFAAETMREIVFEKEALKLSLSVLDLLFPLLNEKIGPDEVRGIIEKTLIAHRKTKEISIQIPPGMKGEIETLINKIRDGEHDEVLWRVVEVSDMVPGNCVLEWSDGGAVRDSVRAAAQIRQHIEALFGQPVPILTDATISEMGQSDVGLALETESGPQASATDPSTPETKND